MTEALSDTSVCLSGKARHSLNLAEEKFCELRPDGVLGSSHLAPVTGIMLTVEGQPANPKRAGSLPYPGSA
jgi:hypothetical protein